MGKPPTAHPPPQWNRVQEPCLFPFQIVKVVVIGSVRKKESDDMSKKYLDYFTFNTILRKGEENRYHTSIDEGD